MSDLPKGWGMAPLAQLGTWCGGGTPSKSEDRFWQDGTIPWVSPKDMKSDVINDSEDHITDAAVEGSTTNLLDAGAVLIVTRSGILQHSLPVATTTNAVTINQDIKALVPHQGLIPEYIAWGLRANARRILRECSKGGTTVQSVETAQLLRFALPIAPSSEQKRIVAAIEEEFSRLDAGVAALQRVRQNLKRMGDSVLDVAVEGCVHAGAESVSLADLVESGRKSAYGVLVPGDHVPDGVPLVRIGDLEHRQVKEEQLKRISPAISARFPRTLLRGGEVLLSLVGTIGRTAVVPMSLAGSNTARAIGVIPIRAGVDPKYVAIALSRRRVTSELTGLSHEVARKTLNLEDVRRYSIPVPRTDTQRMIVLMVEEVEGQLSRLETVILTQARRAESLRSAILASAFSGELVPQDPTDEPASVLLERIAAERASSSGHKSTHTHKPRTTRRKVPA